MSAPKHRQRILGRIARYVFPAIAAEFESDFHLDESVARLRAATRRRVFSLSMREFVAGPVGPDRVRLQRVQPPFSNGFKPIFVGRFSSRPDDRQVLEGTFTTGLPAKVFVTLTLAFIVMWTLFAVTLAIQFPDERGLERWLFPLAGVAFMTIGVQGVRLAGQLSRRDVDVLSAVITRALTRRKGAVERQRPGRRHGRT